MTLCAIVSPQGWGGPDGILAALKNEVAFFFLCDVAAGQLQHRGQDEVAHSHASHVNSSLHNLSGLGYALHVQGTFSGAKGG